MKKFTGAAKRSVMRDWLELFPGLGEYRPLHMLRRAGPILQGIVLEPLTGNEVYRPLSHVHCLLVETPTVTLGLAEHLVTDRTRAPDTVVISRHQLKYRDAARRLREQSQLDFEGDVPLSRLADAYFRYANRAGIHYDHHHLFEELALIYSWAGQRDRADQMIDEGEQRIRRWPSEVVDQVGGLPRWLTRVREAVTDRERLRRLADSHASALGADSLPTASLVLE